MNAILQEQVLHHSPGRTRGASRHQDATAASFSQAQPPGVNNGSAPKPKVLVADDERVIADTLAIILNHSGFEARTVYSGKAAVDSLSNFDPDLLISDVMMPEMTGIEAAIAILAQRPKCKVVLFSGQAATGDLLHEARAKGTSFRAPIETRPSLEIA